MSNSTLKQYGSALKHWHDFCQENGKDFFQIEPNIVLGFLTKLFNSGASYGTINSCRSALSLISESKVGDSASITRFMKGVFKLRPQRPKYSSSWDVSKVLEYLEQLDVTNLENLTYKTAMLLSLGTAQRAQTLVKIKISYITNVTDGIIIKIPDLLKTSGVGRNQPFLHFQKFVNRPKLCILSHLLLYLDRTKNVRNSCDQLFVTIKRPIRAISTQTYSKWIKKCLDRAGIDVSIFSAHSTRHAATSTAAKNGIDVDSIRHTAGWSDQSKVFAKFYNRPVIANNVDFAKSVLQECN